MVGSGRHQRRAIERARELGLRVVGVDRNAEAPGLAVADVGEVVDFTDVEAVTEVGRRHGVDGVLTVSADRAVPVVAAVAESLGLPGIGTETAHAMTHKVAMRRLLAEHGVSQPRFAALRSIAERRAALEAVGVPAVLKPADSGGQRGVFQIASLDDLERAPARGARGVGDRRGDRRVVPRRARAERARGRARRRGRAADALRPAAPAGHRLRRRLDAPLPLDALRRRARARGADDGRRDPRARPAQRHRVPAGDRLAGRATAASSRSRRESPAGRWPISRGTPSASISSRSRCGGARVEVPDELARPRFMQPLAIKFLTASPGPLPTGTHRRASARSRRCSRSRASCRRSSTCSAGETIRPVRLDGDRRGYVIAVADTNVEALERAEAAARLVDVIVE